MFCQDCGEELPKDANFCPKCGIMTMKGVDAGVSTPWEELKDVFSKIGEEIEKAFLIAGREMEKAFTLSKKAREETKEVVSQEPVVCPHCGEKNVADARFCYKCGKKLD